jgi:hypothetical protein
MAEVRTAMGPNVPIDKTMRRIMATARLHARRDKGAEVHPITEESYVGLRVFVLFRKTKDETDGPRKKIAFLNCCFIRILPCCLLFHPLKL